MTPRRPSGGGGGRGRRRPPNAPPSKRTRRTRKGDSTSSKRAPARQKTAEGRRGAPPSARQEVAKARGDGSARVAVAKKPILPPVPEASRVQRGDWVWSTRAGAERDLAQELNHLDRDCRAAPTGPGLVRTSERPDGAPAFGRQVMQAKALFASPADAPVSDAWMPRVQWLGRELEQFRLSLRPGASPFSWAAHVYTADTNEGREASRRAAEIRTLVESELSGALGPPLDPLRDASESVALVQALAIDERRWALGIIPSSEALSLSPGGIRRLRMPADAPSRAALKLQEGLEWVGLRLATGEVAVDLGAAPGGWTWTAVQQGVRVLAVDPGRLRRDLEAHPRVTYYQQSAFDFEPPSPVDWLLGDMAWRPLEVAALVAKWFRRRWAQFALVNFKLPMKEKVSMVYRIIGTLEGAGARGIRVRQLYHDRNEVTVFAHL